MQRYNWAQLESLPQLRAGLTRGYCAFVLEFTNCYLLVYHPQVCQTSIECNIVLLLSDPHRGVFICEVHTEQGQIKTF